MIKWKKIGLAALCVILTLPLQAQVDLIRQDPPTPEERYKFLFAEGLRYKTLGETDRAVANFQQCIELKPEAGAPFYELGLHHLEKKDYATAEGYARNAWKRDQGNEWYGLLLSEALIAQGKYEPCAEIYAGLQKTYPNRLEFLASEIDVLQEAGLHKEALKRLSKAAGHPSLNRWSALKEFELQTAMDQAARGAAALEKWLTKNPSDLEVRGLLAESYSSRGEKDKALKHYTHLLIENPENPAVNFSYGHFLFTQGNRSEAVEAFLKGFRSTDVNPVIKIAIISEFLKGSKQEEPDPEVIEMIRVVYETDKGHPEVDAMYANYLYTVNRPDEAEPIYRRILRTDPGNYLAWQNLLFILNEQEKPDQIAAVADSALTYFPMQSLFHLFKGIGAIGIKDY
ncbi:MAG: tetratricopeptide repeat protein, partial [Bacteroidales bacterium]